jgi:hypothetical protein
MRTLRSLALVAILTALAGCRPASAPSVAVGRSTGSVVMAGREVRFSVDGRGSVKGGSGGSTVIFDEGEILVEKSRILVNGKVVAPIPDNAKLVEIDYGAGQLTIKVDGVDVHKGKFAK